MSEPLLKEKAAVLRCMPQLQSASGGPMRVQRFQVVERTGELEYTWISQHRHEDTARFAALCEDRPGVRIFDVHLSEFLSLDPTERKCAG